MINISTLEMDPNLTAELLELPNKIITGLARIPLFFISCGGLLQLADAPISSIRVNSDDG